MSFINDPALFIRTGSSQPEYTHLVFPYVPASDEVISSSVWGLISSNLSGSIEPTTLTWYGETLTILNLYSTVASSSSTITLEVNGFLDSPDSNLYLGRSDTKTYYGLPDSSSEEFGTAEWSGRAQLFNLADYNQWVPIWLANTPPPGHENIVQPFSIEVP